MWILWICLGWALAVTQLLVTVLVITRWINHAPSTGGDQKAHLAHTGTDMSPYSPQDSPQ